MVITTGAVMVVATGMVCATIMQYFLQLPYVPAGMLIVNVLSAKVTA
jgi:hypothetical protein